MEYNVVLKLFKLNILKLLLSGIYRTNWTALSYFLMEYTEPLEITAAFLTVAQNFQG